MTGKEMVLEIIKEYACLNSTEISQFIKRKFNEDVSSSSAAGAIRPLIAQGYAASSRDANNRTVYWLTDYGKEKLR